RRDERQPRRAARAAEEPGRERPTRAGPVGERPAEQVAREARDRDRRERERRERELDAARPVQVDDEERHRQPAAERGEEIAAEDDPRLPRQPGHHRRIVQGRSTGYNSPPART